MNICVAVSDSCWRISRFLRSRSLSASATPVPGVRGAVQSTVRTQAIAIAYDGLNPMPPMFCYLKPYYNDVNRSYFEQLASGEI